MKILIAEDNEENRNLLAKQLRAYGHEITAVANGIEALEQALAQPPDIIVSDILMPKMDGYQLCQKWKQNDKLKDIPFVFYTATYTSDEDEKFGLTLGASAFIRKPAEHDIFIQTLTGVFEKAQSGVLAPDKFTPLEPSLFISKYTERVSAKLEHKVAQLEAEIAHRKQVEARVEHLNLVLKAIRGVNQLIITEKERDRLLKGACNSLIKTRGYHSVWLALLDKSGGLVTTAEAGWGEDFLPVVEQLKRGELTDCARRALKQPDIVVITDPLATCGECPLAEKCHGRGAATTRLEHGGKVYGIVSVAVPADLVADEEERSLFREVVGDIAFALHTMELEDKRKRAEERIKRAAEEWRTTFDSITDLVFICDKDFRFTRVNKAFADAFKMKPVELIGKHCYEIFHKTNKPIPNCPYKETIKTKKPATVEFFEPHLGMYLEMATSPIFNEKGEVVASVHVIRDITERKKMEEQLIVTDRLASIGELASGIAHELNNPLTSVIGFSQLLLEKDVPDDVREDLKIIHSEAQRTAKVVKNLLTFARKHDTEKGPVNINSIIEKVLELRAYEQKVSNIQVNTRFAPDLPEIMADYFQLQQVFLNIVINAEHFMIEANNRGTLTITTEKTGDIIKTFFADDGPGISKENLGHLFDPFFTTKEVGKGTGLGLSICHGIITEHGGRIYAESKLGKGATFVVELPITIDKKEAVK